MVRLRNGSVIRGEIIKNSVDDMLVIRIDSTDIPLKYDQIIAIKTQGFKYRTDYPVNEQGYFNYSSLGLILQRSNSGDPIVAEPSIHTVNGYIFNRFLKLGVGIGYDGYPDINTFPVYLNIQGEALNSKVSPMYAFGIGYGFAGARDKEWGQIRNADGGLFMQPSAGIVFHGIRNSFAIALDYKYQITYLDYNDWWWGGQLSETRTFRNLAIRLGFVF
jgi:hypothetical protein